MVMESSNNTLSLLLAVLHDFIVSYLVRAGRNSSFATLLMWCLYYFVLFAPGVLRKKYVDKLLCVNGMLMRGAHSRVESLIGLCMWASNCMIHEIDSVNTTGSKIHYWKWIASGR